LTYGVWYGIISIACGTGVAAAAGWQSMPPAPARATGECTHFVDASIAPEKGLLKKGRTP